MTKQKNVAIHSVNIRVWYVKGGVHPYHPPEYLVLGKLGDPSKSHGDATRITAPDPNNYNKDVTVGEVPGTEERATMTVSARYTVEIATLLNLFRTKCRVDLWAMIGKCGHPQDFQLGAEKRLFFQDGKPSTWTGENFGGFGTDDNNPVNENMDMTSEDLWEQFKMGTDKVLDTAATGEILTVDVCDNADCGDCGDQSDGCSRVLATMAGVGATPGTKPVLFFSEDGGETWETETISTMFSSESPADGECIGGDLVLISTDGNEFHYRDVDDIFFGIGEWGEADTGFVVGGEPVRMSSAGARHTWVVGNGGYIYFTKNPRTGVKTQDAGITTTENLTDVNAFDSENVLVVGENNVVMSTNNGGNTWNLITGPAVGENLGVCYMWDVNTWLIGTGAGGSGKFYKTKNGGFDWDEVEMPLTGIGQFDRIEFSSEGEGYLALRTGGNAKILRTLTAGYEWWELPDGTQSNIELVDYINDLAVCLEDSNTVFAGGMDDDGTTGFVLKGSGPTV